MDFKPEDIGGKLLEVITSGLYDGNLNCLREYVQNAIDSKPKEILITLEPNGTIIEIRDDGSGMNEEEFKKALRIGISEKSVGDVGWRGIGIWSGVPACERIVIISKKRGSEKLRLEIDNEEIRKTYLLNNDITEILTQATTEVVPCELGNGESFDESHYTIIRLEGIRPSQKYWYSETNVMEYLQKTIPAPFNPSFKMGEEINKVLEGYGLNDLELMIKFNDEPIYRPPTKEELFFDKFTVKEFNVMGKLVAVGWSITSKKSTVLKPPNKGIKFKKNRFTIGNETLVRTQLDSGYTFWQYGEIHILDQNIKENSARNNFTYDIPEVELFMKEVGEFIRVLDQQNHLQTDVLFERRNNKIEKFIEKKNYGEALKWIKKTDEKLKSPRSPPDDPDLNGMVAVIRKESKKHVAVLNKHRETIKRESKTSKKDTSNKILDNVIDNLPNNVKKHFKKIKKGNRLELEINLTQSLLEALQKRIGSTEPNMSEITRVAYGWKNVNKKNDPKIVIDNRKGKEARYVKDRNRQLGVMLYTVHDLFVNLPKHATGKQPMEWYDGQTKEKQEQLLTWMVGTITLLIHLVEQSEDYIP